MNLSPAASKAFFDAAVAALTQHNALLASTEKLQHRMTAYRQALREAQ